MPHPPPAPPDPRSRRGLWTLLAFTAVYLPVTGLLADRAPLWYDELFTVYVSQLAGPADLWQALAEGTDTNPPLYLVLTRFARLGFGESELATRIPAVFGFWVLCVSVYAFVARRCRREYALAAMLLPLATAVYPMAYSARAYGWLLGCCGFALVCWQSAAEGARRRLALAGLAVGGALAFASHYYAFLALAPLCVGEVVRTVARRRLDVPMWLALAAGPLTLAALLPLALGAQESMTAYTFAPGWAAIPASYHYLLKSARWPLVGVVAIAMLGLLVNRQPALNTEGPPGHEWAAVLVFAALPVVGVCLGQWVTGIFTARYAAPAVIGWAIGLALLADRRFGDRRLVALALAAVFLVRFAGHSWREYGQQTRARAEIARTLKTLDHHSGEPIAVADPFAFLQLVYYAPPAVRAELVYLQNLEAARRHNPTDPRDWHLGQLRRWAAVPVQDYHGFRTARDRFWVYGDAGWLRPTLEADGVRLRPCAGGLFEARAR